MKKIILNIGIIAILLIVLIGLTGCGNDNNNEISNDNQQVSEETNNNSKDETQEKAEINFDTSQYDYVKMCSNNKTVLAGKGSYYIYLDLNGNRITDKDYWALDNTIPGTEFNNGYVIVEETKDGLKGLMNEKGEEIITCQYKYMRYDTDEKLYLVNKDYNHVLSGNPYYINEKNEKVKDW